jgi:hypothetical protein
MAAKTAQPAAPATPAAPAALPADWYKKLVPHFGAEVLSKGAGRTATPSVFLDAAARSLAESSIDLSHSWVAFQAVSTVYVQQLVNEWTKAARALKCGLSKHVTEHANGTVDVAFRCQAKRDKAPNKPKESATA